MDLPQEIFDEIMMHLRRGWAAHPTVLSNSGLQIALTCSRLYRELIPEIKDRQKAIVASAIDAKLPGPSPNHGSTRLLVLSDDIGREWKVLNSTEFSVYQDRDFDFNGRGIRTIYLNLPVLRHSDKDLIWGVQQLVNHLPKRESIGFHLSLHHSDEFTERDGSKKATWVRVLTRLLDTITLQRGWILHMKYVGGSDQEDNDHEDLRTLIGNEVSHKRAQGGAKSSGLRPILSRATTHGPSFFSALKRGSRSPGLSSVTLAGPLSNPLLHAYACRIISRSRAIYSLNVEGRSTQSIWDPRFSTDWTLPQLTSLRLTNVAISFPILFTFLTRHPTITHLYAYQWHQVEADATTPSPAAGKPAKLSITSLTSDPLSLKVLFNSTVELPRLRSLSIQCIDGTTFDYSNPVHWTDLTLVLALLARSPTTMRVSTPLRLSLDLPRCDHLLSWLKSIHIRSQDSHRRPGTSTATTSGAALQSILHRLGTTQKRPVANFLIDKTNPPPLSDVLRSLHCVTSFSLFTGPVPAYYLTQPAENVSRSVVAALITALPSLEALDVSASFTSVDSVSSGLNEEHGEIWGGLTEVLSRATTLKTLDLYDSGVYPSINWTWRKGWTQLREVGSD